MKPSGPVVFFVGKFLIAYSLLSNEFDSIGFIDMGLYIDTALYMFSKFLIITYAFYNLNLLRCNLHTTYYIYVIYAQQKCTVQ